MGTTTINKVIAYYESEYKSAVRAVKSPHFKPADVIKYATQRCLGVCQFAQFFDDVTYEDLFREYEVIRTKLENLLDK